MDETSSLAGFEVRPMLPGEIGAVARMHCGFLESGEFRGYSIANLGVQFLENVFYRLNLDNPYFFADVACYRDEIIGFIVYASDGRRVFRETLRRHYVAVAAATLKLLLRHPLLFIGHIVWNFGLLTHAVPESIKEAHGWGFIMGVRPEFRKIRLGLGKGVWPAGELWKRMENTLREKGCEQIWGVPGVHNTKMLLLQRLQGMEPVAEGQAQGLPSIYYRKFLTKPAKKG